VEEFHGQLKIGGGKKKSAPRLEGKRKKKKKKLALFALRKFQYYSTWLFDLHDTYNIIKSI
jgi:hypothetical protein